MDPLVEASVPLELILGNINPDDVRITRETHMAQRAATCLKDHRAPSRTKQRVNNPLDLLALAHDVFVLTVMPTRATPSCIEL
jgi:cytochrome b